MCKGALTHEAFESYVPLIEEETRQYFELIFFFKLLFYLLLFESEINFFL